MIDKIKQFLPVLMAFFIMIGYLLLVYQNKAPVDGFIALAMYTIKKVLDIHEDNQPTQNGGTKDEIKITSSGPAIVDADPGKS